MKILLINNNPVVSRLTALSARKEDIEIDEIQEVTELSSDAYDVVFVDADSWSKDVSDVILDNIKPKKSVLFYSEGDEEEKSFFDLTILKPFLPSEVSAVIRSIEEKNETLNEEEVLNIFDDNKLDDNKKDEKDELFDLDGLDEVETKKEEIALTLDKDLDLKVEEPNFNEKLEEAFPEKLNALDDDVFNNELSLEKSKETTSDDFFDLDLNDEIPLLDDALFTLDKKEDKKEKTLDKKEETLDKKEETLDKQEKKSDKIDLDIVEEIKKEEEATKLLSDDSLALELDEPIVEERKKETQVLDEVEIENIKGILTQDSNSPDMSLDDLMSSVFEEEKINKKEKKKSKKEKSKEEDHDSSDLDSNLLAETFASMPVENLRQLLAGSKINIQIKFPKSQ